jgi:hypothetical protein
MFTAYHQKYLAKNPVGDWGKRSSAALWAACDPCGVTRVPYGQPDTMRGNDARLA